MLSAVSAARPEVVVHQLSALRLLRDDPPGAFALTARLRTEGTAHLVEAARAAGARRLVAQSIAFAAAPAGEPVLDEDAPLYVDAPDPGWASTVRAVAELERQVTGGGLEGVALRYGTLYGPRTAYARTGTTAGPSWPDGSRCPAAGRGSCRSCTSRTPWGRPWRASSPTPPGCSM